MDEEELEEIATTLLGALTTVRAAVRGEARESVADLGEVAAAAAVAATRPGTTKPRRSARLE